MNVRFTFNIIAPGSVSDRFQSCWSHSAVVIAADCQPSGYGFQPSHGRRFFFFFLLKHSRRLSGPEQFSRHTQAEAHVAEWLRRITCARYLRAQVSPEALLFDFCFLFAPAGKRFLSFDFWVRLPPARTFWAVIYDVKQEIKKDFPKWLCCDKNPVYFGPKHDHLHLIVNTLIEFCTNTIILSRTQS